jgi:hypothetical protein
MNGNNDKPFGLANVVRVLFYVIFLGVVGWGTYVFTMASSASRAADQAISENKVQDERINGIKEDLRDIRNDQKEILRRLK